MKRILVTGCAGFIGSHLSEKLLKLGFEVLGLDNLSNGKLSNIDSFKKNKNFKFFKCDINEKKVFDDLLDEVEVIYHLAALADIVPSIQNPEIYFNSNVNGTFNLLKNCKKKKCKKNNLCSVFIMLRNSKKISYFRKKSYITKIPICINQKISRANYFSFWKSLQYSCCEFEVI